MSEEEAHAARSQAFEPVVDQGGSATTPASPVLEVDHVSKVFHGQFGLRRTRWATHAVRDVSFQVGRGASLALVGESGSGKTTLARLIVGLEMATVGQILLEGRRWEARVTPGDRVRRAKLVQIVFQDPYTSLTPHQAVGEALDEAQQVHFSRDVARRRERTDLLLTSVGLGERERTSLPRHLSGGQRQRAAIARALAAEPRLLVLDEPVSALDVSIQAQILNLLADLRRDLSLTYLFITHDLAVVRQVADTVVVLYRGRVVEQGPVELILKAPSHPYTQRLIDSVPRPGRVPTRRLGVVDERDTGCLYRARCPIARAECANEPGLLDLGAGQSARCWFARPTNGTHAHELVRGTADGEAGERDAKATTGGD